MPCQDYASGRRRYGVAAIALADGAGSRTHSALGASTAVRISLRLLTSAFDNFANMIERDEREARRCIFSEIARALSSVARRSGVDAPSLASTLLFAAFKEDRFLAGHLGDGAIAMVDAEDMATVLSSPENGEYTNTTYFLTDHAAEDRLRLYSGTLRRGGFVLMSDGAAEVLYHRSTRSMAPAVSQLVSWNRRFRRPKVEGALRENLAGPLARSSDDLSVAVLSTAT